MTIEPAKRDRADDDRERGRDQVERRRVDRSSTISCSSSSATSAAAPPPTPLNSATSCGICGHLDPLRADDTDRRCRPRSRPGSAATWSRSSARRTARRTASDRADGADQVAVARGLRRRETLEREDEADRGDQVDELRPRSGVRRRPRRRSSAGLRLLAREHLQHPVGDDEAADHVDRGEHDRDQPERRAPSVVVGAAGDDDRADAG